MKAMETVAALAWRLFPMAVVLVLTVAAVWMVRRWAARRADSAAEDTSFVRDMLSLVIVTAAAVPLLVTLPVSEHTRDSLFTLFGIAVTAVVSLGSSTFASNAMAGLMLRIIRNFKVGDYVHVGEHFGRVTERGLLHTEIQTERSDLITFPNLHMVTHPVRVVRPTGTFVSARLSLGYEVHNREVERLLLEAAASVGLENAFVRILELGDFSVTYEVSGKLTDTKRFLGARSALARAVLDTLHGAGVEIVSPAYMNQRRIPADRPVIPRPAPETGPPADGLPEPDAQVFDKADRAEKLDVLRTRLAELTAEIEELEKNAKAAQGKAREHLEHSLRRRRELATRIDRRIGELTAEDED